MEKVNQIVIVTPKDIDDLRYAISQIGEDGYDGQGYDGLADGYTPYPHESVQLYLDDDDNVCGEGVSSRTNYIFCSIA